MGCDITSGFIFRHYYDLYDDSGFYDGVYVCDKCGYRKKWTGDIEEYLSCDNDKKDCVGTMRLHVFRKETVQKILSGDVQIKLA
jgi:hypothetical protein